MTSSKQRRDIDKAIANLLKYSEREPWERRFQNAIGELFQEAAQHLKITTDELTDVLSDTGVWHMVYGYAFEDFASTYWDNEENTFIDDYLNRRACRESGYARHYLRALNDTGLMLWEVKDVKPGYYVDVRLYGTSDEAHRVYEKAATENLNRWDCLAARVIKLNRKFGFTGALLPLTPEQAASVNRIIENTAAATVDMMKASLEKGEIPALPDNLEQTAFDESLAHLPVVLFTLWASGIYAGVNQPIPELRNRDGDIFQFSTVRFPIKTDNIDDIRTRLDTEPNLDRHDREATWAWLPCAVDDIPEGGVSLLGEIRILATTV